MKGHYIMSVHQKDLPILNVYAPKNTAKYGKQKLIELKRDIKESTVIVGEFSILLSIIDKTTRQKISTYVEELNTTIRQLTGLKTAPTLAEYTFFSRIHGTLLT